MSLKQFFVLFSSKVNFVPTIYKTKATINRHLEKNQNLQFKIFNSEDQANWFVKSLTNQVHTPFIKENNEIKQVQQTEENKIPTDRSQLQQIKNLDAAYKKRIELIKNHYLFKNFTPTPLLRQTIPDKINLFFDGSSRFNPGPAAIGYIAKTADQKVCFKRGWGIGYKTNNEAQFCAFAWGLFDSVLKGVLQVNVFGDSTLVLNAMTGTYNIKKHNLLQYVKLCKQIQDLLLKVNYQHIDRSYNHQADALARKITDAAVQRFKM